MERAFGDVTRRHDSLRIVLESIDVDPRLRIDDDVEPPVEFLDLSRFEEKKQRTLLPSSCTASEDGASTS
jgi:hypothetical protein